MCLQSLYVYFNPLLSLEPDNISLKVSAVNTSSITVIPSGPPGGVSYEETGSSDDPTNVSYSPSITISKLEPNTWYTITYTVQNSYDTKMINVTRLTTPEGELALYGTIICPKLMVCTLAILTYKSVCFQIGNI